jgi:sucrose-6-phosphate hydrolase SacC (GH32 family)
MKKLKKQTIEVREDDVTVVQIEVDKPLIEFYKKETGRSHITKKGLSSFINHLIKLHKSNCSLL